MFVYAVKAKYKLVQNATQAVLEPFSDAPAIFVNTAIMWLIGWSGARWSVLWCRVACLG
jgi:hypothetical protein